MHIYNNSRYTHTHTHYILNRKSSEITNHNNIKGEDEEQKGKKKNKATKTTAGKELKKKKKNEKNWIQNRLDYYKKHYYYYNLWIICYSLLVFFLPLHRLLRLRHILLVLIFKYIFVQEQQYEWKMFEWKNGWMQQRLRHNRRSNNNNTNKTKINEN